MPTDAQFQPITALKKKPLLMQNLLWNLNSRFDVVVRVVCVVG
jgi:hypothetical protein